MKNETLVLKNIKELENRIKRMKKRIDTLKLGISVDTSKIKELEIELEKIHKQQKA